MDFSKLGCYAASERVAEIRHTSAVDAKDDSQMIIGRASVELGSRIRGLSIEMHIATVFGQEDSVSGASLNRPGPIQLPYGKVGVSMKAE
jgi:hypothetical protein